MDFCAGGEFFGMLQRQPHRCMTEVQVRFYAAEVLMALEYLHIQGFIYRGESVTVFLVFFLFHIAFFG